MLTYVSMPETLLLVGVAIIVGYVLMVARTSRRGGVSYCVQNRLRKTSGHGKRLIAEIDLLTKGVTP